MSEIEMTLKKYLAQAVKDAFNVEIDVESILIEIPKDKNHGDYSTNIAMRLTKELKKNPREVAQMIIDALDKENASVSTCEIAGPGFINFVMNSESITSVIKTIIDLDDKYGCSPKRNVSYNLEYVSANPTGDLHPGHARGAAIGDSVARIMKMAGFDVTSEFYVNDAGNQITNMALSLQARYLQSFGIDASLPEDGYHGPDLIMIAENLKNEVGDKYVTMDKEKSLPLFREYGLKAELDKLERDLELFNVKFDVWSKESDIRNKGLAEKSLNQLIENGMTYKEDGALWLKTTLYGDDKDRVLVKSDGSYTYLTPDIAYHLDKLDRGYDFLVDFLGADHHGYIARLKASIQALGYEADRLDVDIIQMARMIKDGEEFKLSKRSGKSVALKDLIDEAGVDAVRYYFASRAADTQMDFDLDMATKQSNENPVYYAQYAHARMCSILAAASDIETASNFDLITNSKEISLCKHLNEFNKVVNDAAETRQPHKMCNYIRTLAQNFHSFYGECKVIDYDNIDLSKQRLGLVLASKTVLKNALNSIGVSAPEKM